MINTLQRIGQIVRNDSVGRVKYHPLISLIDINSDKYKKIKYDVYEIEIDTINKTMSTPSLIPSTLFNVLKYDVGGKTFPYIIGNYEYINTGKKTENHILSCLSNLTKLNITDSLFITCANIIDSNNISLNNIICNVQKDDGLIFNIKIDGVEFFDNSHIMNVIDDAYINNITSKNSTNNIVLNNSLFGFFNTNDKISQSPNFKFDDTYKSFYLTNKLLNDLIYSVKFHETKLKYIINDYMFTYLPNFDSLTYDILDNQITAKTISSISKDISKTRNISIVPSLDDLIDDMLNCGLNKLPSHIKKDEVNFDIIFKLKGGNTTNDVLLLRNYKLTEIEKLNNKVNCINKKVCSNDYSFNIKYAFERFFKKENETKTKAYGSFIFKWIVEIFQDNYYKNLMLSNILIQKIEYAIRNKSTLTEVKNEYSKIISNYKFLRYMEKTGEEDEKNDMNTNSYLLGKKIGKFCQIWKDDRANLVKHIENFNGQISRRIRTKQDASHFFYDIIERLNRNKSIFSKVEFDEIRNFFDTFVVEFDSQLFIKGYFDAQYSYNKTEIK